MKAIKFILWFTGVGVVVAIGVVVALINLVDPNEYKPQVASWVEEKTGRRLELNGDLKLSFFPWIGIRADDVSLSDRHGFDERSMATFRSVEVKASLLPLFQRQLEVDTMILVEPSVRLTIRPDGSNNWEDLLPRRGGDQTEAQIGAKGLAGMVFQGVSLEDGHIEFVNQRDNRSVVLSNVNLSTGRLTEGKPMEVRLSSDADSNLLSDPLALSLSSTLLTTDDSNHIVFSNTRLDLQQGDEEYEFAMDSMEVNRIAQSVLVSEIGAINGGTEITLREFSVSGFAEASLAGKLQLSSDDILSLLSKHKLKLETGRYAVGPVNLEAGFEYDKDLLKINSMEANAPDVRLVAPF